MYAALILSAPSPRSLSTSLGVSTNESLSVAQHADGGAGELFRRAQAQVSSVSVHLAQKKGGRYRWEWEPAANPAREDIRGLARRTNGNLQARILLGSSVRGAESTSYDVGMVALDEELWRSPAKPRKWPREWEMDRFSAREELFWTFKQPQKPVGGLKAILGLIVVASPWLVLLSFVSLLFGRIGPASDLPLQAAQLLPSIKLAMPVSAVPFLMVLAALEGLIVSYWSGVITAWQLMPLASGAGVTALFAGKAALSARLRDRELHGAKVVKMG